MRTRYPLHAFFLALLLIVRAAPSTAALELHDVRRLQLHNGMTVLLLEDRNFPVVSVQMLYRVGARNETTGKTGLAHFLEHMAFRSTENFPDNAVVSRIYAVGGEWHGYTWIDQTTYFATVPREHWPLLLQIEADRMFRLEIDPATIEAEKGAVLAEMHMYENDPASTLIDALAFSSFLAHPYRNNTIGWESDVESFAVDDVRDFYDRHYHPANAVLAVVGDADMDEVEAKIEALFGDADSRPRTPLPHTGELRQQGIRRVVIDGVASVHEFRIGYRAPSVGHPDFAAFLVLQELLAGSSGVNFLQNDWGTPARPGRPLEDTVSGVTTWFPPSEQNYLFAIGGSIGPEDSEEIAEAAIETVITGLRTRAPDAATVVSAVDAVLDELSFDVETTEDAAHQLATFASFGALDVLLTLPERLRRVTGADVTRVARTWLAPGQRTVVWHRPSELTETRSRSGTTAVDAEPPAGDSIDDFPAAGSTLRRLDNGLPAIVIGSDLSPSVYLKVVVPAPMVSEVAFSAGDPEPGLTSWNARARSGGLAGLAERAVADLRHGRPVATAGAPASLDPATRLEEEILALMLPDARAAGVQASPMLVVAAGDVDIDDAFDVLQAGFGALEIADVEALRVRRNTSRWPQPGRRTIELPLPVAQSQLGYVVAAPAPGDPDFFAWRVLQYIFAHDYEGRFGRAAISERGLAYFIDARYVSTGGPGWTQLSVGVDTTKLSALEELLSAELARLETDPPTMEEVDEARSHLLGRAISAAQSNGELATAVARHYLHHGELPSLERTEGRLEFVSVEDVVALVPRFVSGVTVTVLSGPAAHGH
jgi:zinc protease